MEATIQLLRKYGRRLRTRDLPDSQRLTGQLTMCTVQHRGYGSVSILQLTAVENQTTDGKLAELYEPILTGLGHGRLTFRGIERIQTQDGPVGYAQEWRCTVER